MKNQWWRPGSPSPATPITADSDTGRMPVARAGFGREQLRHSPDRVAARQQPGGSVRHERAQREQVSVARRPLPETDARISSCVSVHSIVTAARSHSVERRSITIRPSTSVGAVDGQRLVDAVDRVERGVWAQRQPRLPADRRKRGAKPVRGELRARSPASRRSMLTRRPPAPRPAGRTMCRRPSGRPRHEPVRPAGHRREPIRSARRPRRARSARATAGSAPASRRAPTRRTVARSGRSNGFRTVTSSSSVSPAAALARYGSIRAPKPSAPKSTSAAAAARGGAHRAAARPARAGRDTRRVTSCGGQWPLISRSGRRRRWSSALRP